MGHGDNVTLREPHVFGTLQWHPNLDTGKASLELPQDALWDARDISFSIQHSRRWENTKPPRAQHGHVNTEC